MTKHTIPMNPRDLPQQRLYEVVDLPQWPDQREIVTGYGLPREIEDRSHPRLSRYVCQLEWAWSPMHGRVALFYISSTAKHWVLWLRFHDENDDTWNWTAVAACQKQDIRRHVAACHLLLAFLRFDEEAMEGGCYHWVNGTGVLEVSDINAIARCVWG